MSVIHAILHWLGTISGVQIPAGQYSPWYNFWSGFGGILLTPSLFVGLTLYLRHTNCHVKGCWRHGSHKFTDNETHTDYRLCSKHHPHIPKIVTLEHILHIHRRNTEEYYER